MRTPAKKAESRTVPVLQVVEVQKYVYAEDRLQRFIQEHAEVMDEFSTLVEERNDALQEADNAVRALCKQYGAGINCGPFRFKHFTNKIDGEAMFDSLGREQYEKLGGAIKTVPKYVVDAPIVLKAITSGQISVEVADSFYQLVPNYHKIPVVVLP